MGLVCTGVETRGMRQAVIMETDGGTEAQGG